MRNVGRWQNGWQQRQARQIQKKAAPPKKLEPPTGKKQNQNPPRPGNLQNEFTEEERSWVPRGLAQTPVIIHSFRQLNLADEQKAKLRNLSRQVGNQIFVLAQLQRAQNNAWEEALYARDFDAKLTERRAAELATAQMELTKSQLNARAQIRQILTPEQAARFRDLLDDKKPNPNPLRPGNPPDDLTMEERAMVARGMPRAPALTRALRQLDLTDDQKVKLRNLTRQIGNQIQTLNQLHRAQNNAWEEALYARDFDSKQAERRATELADTQMELAKLQFGVLAQIRQILTPEQALRFRDLLIEERQRQNNILPTISPTPR